MKKLFLSSLICALLMSPALVARAEDEHGRDRGENSLLERLLPLLKKRAEERREQQGGGVPESRTAEQAEEPQEAPAEPATTTLPVVPAPATPEPAPQEETPLVPNTAALPLFSEAVLNSQTGSENSLYTPARTQEERSMLLFSLSAVLLAGGVLLIRRRKDPQGPLPSALQKAHA